MPTDDHPDRDDLQAELTRLRVENRDLRRRLGLPGLDPDPQPGIDIAPTTDFTTDVDLGGLMAVVSKHLYSTPMVALRELVQNAHDSIIRRRRADTRFAGGRIHVDVVDGRLVVSDDGDGMTESEVHECLATVGRGATGAARRATGDPDLIGQFGLGFLSAFVLGDSVEAVTLSADDPSVAHRYESADGLTYQVTSHEPSRRGNEPGTTVSVRLSGTGLDLVDEAVLSSVLGRYCALLKVPVMVAGTQVNVTPPWRVGFDDPTVASSAARTFAARFESGHAPLCTLPIGAEADSDAVGTLWIQDGRSWATSDNRNLSVFVRGMLLDDDARDLLPRWAGFVGGVVESTSLVPTASREDLQRTPAYEATQAALSRQLVAGLSKVAASDPAGWRRVVRRHNEALLGAAMVDETVFELVADVIEVPTSEGDMRPSELLRRSDGRIHVSLSVGGGFEEMVCRCLRVPVARGFRFGVAPFLRQWCNLRGASYTEVGTPEGDRDLFLPAEIAPDAEAWLGRTLVDADEQLIASRFDPASLPLVLVPDREAELKARLEDDEADQRISAAALSLARSHTARIAARPTVQLHLNLRSEPVQRLLDAHAIGDPGADEAVAVLRSVKVLLASGGPGADDSRLVDALDQLGRTMCDRLGGNGREDHLR